MISLLTVGMGLVYFWLWDRSVDVQQVAMSYNSVVDKGEVWRIFTASFSHLNLLHVGMNLSSLIGLVPLEIIWGSSRFLLCVHAARCLIP